MGPLLGAVCNLSYFLLFKLPLLSLLFFLTQKNQSSEKLGNFPMVIQGSLQSPCTFYQVTDALFQKSFGEVPGRSQEKENNLRKAIEQSI